MLSPFSAFKKRAVKQKPPPPFPILDPKSAQGIILEFCFIKLYRSRFVIEFLGSKSTQKRLGEAAVISAFTQKEF